MSAESIAAGIIKNAAFVPERAAAYGFVHKDGVYAYTTVISDGQFSLTIECGPDGFLRSEIKERDTDEPYTLPFVAGAAGGFVGAVRAEYERMLADIAEHCFQRRAFKERQTQCILDYAKDKYGDCPEFLWNNSENAVFRRGDNKKWYAVFLTGRKDRLGEAGEGNAEIIDLRMEPEDLEKAVAGGRYLRGYHMNKKHWITVVLDGRVPTGEICALLDKSYLLARK